MPDDERPTEPAAPRVRCPRCAGEGAVLVVDENAIGYRGARGTCPLCKGASVVDRSTFAAWQARSQGRTSDS